SSKRHRSASRREDQDHHQHQPSPQAPADQLFLDGQQRLDRHLAHFFADFGLLHDLSPFQPAASGGFTPPKNTHEITSPTQMTKPNRHTTQTAASVPTAT